MSRLLALVLVPTLVLAALWNWAGERAASGPVTTVPAVEADEVRAPSDRGAVTLTWRRIADAVVADEIADERRAGLDRLAGAVDDRTCLVVDSGSAVIVARDRAINLGPAQAVVVAAAGLMLLGPDHRPVTSLLGSPPVDGVVEGDLVLVGGGDALLGTESVSGPPRRHPLPTTPLEALAVALGLAGVERVTGDVIGVSDRYDDLERPAGWEVPLIEAARVGALLVDRGRIRSGPENVALGPAQGAARSMLEVLRESSIVVEGSARTDSAAALDGREVLAEVEGEPLGEVVAGWLAGPESSLTVEGWAEFSDALLMEIGVTVAGSGTRLGGAAAVSALLEEVASGDRAAGAGWDLVADLRDGPGLDAESTASCGVLAWALTTIEGVIADPEQRIGLDIGSGGDRRAVVAELPGGTRARIVVVGNAGAVEDVLDAAWDLHSTSSVAVAADQLAPAAAQGR